MKGKNVIMNSEMGNESAEEQGRFASSVTLSYDEFRNK